MSQEEATVYGKTIQFLVGRDPRRSLSIKVLDSIELSSPHKTEAPLGMLTGPVPSSLRAVNHSALPIIYAW